MQKIASLDGLVPGRLRPMTRKIVLEDYRLDLDIGFHEFEIGNPQRLLVTVEVWVDERSFSADDEAGSEPGTWKARPMPVIRGGAPANVDSRRISRSRAAFSAV